MTTSPDPENGLVTSADVSPAPAEDSKTDVKAEPTPDATAEPTPVVTSLPANEEATPTPKKAKADPVGADVAPGKVPPFPGTLYAGAAGPFLQQLRDALEYEGENDTFREDDRQKVAAWQGVHKRPTRNGYPTQADWALIFAPKGN